jgi:hypothetical protein
MIKSVYAIVLSLLLAVTAGPSFAQSGSGGEFTIYNNTDNNIVIGFYTNDGDGWSSNWLSEDLEPDQEAYASFYADGTCDQLFQVGWLGQNDSEVLDEPISIDVCDASNIYLDDNEIYYD